MAISSDVFCSLLALDAYNRGYNAGIKLAGNTLGDAKIIGDSEKGLLNQAIGPVGGVDKNFYALAYDMSGVSGWSGASTVISYRGTDDEDWDKNDSDNYLGWPIGLGNISPQTQTLVAFQFYLQVIGNADPQTASVELTGHSLGGGIAGMVAATFGRNATIFDNMAFENATNNIYSHAMGWSINLNPWLTETVYKGQPPWAPIIGSNISGYAVKGEILETNRVLSGFTPESIESESVGKLDDKQLHSQALLTTLLYGEKEISDKTWLTAREYFVRYLLDDNIALAAGAESISGRFNNEKSYASILATAIAYSAIDEGTRPFGDTGIRALYNDAGDLGTVLEDKNISGSLKGLAGALSQTLVQFAGQLANRKVTAAAPDGVLSLSGDQKVLTVDFADGLWKTGGAAPSEILGRKEIVNAAIIDAGAAPIHSGMSWLWNSDSSDIIDRVELATTNEALTTTLQNRTTASDKVSLFVAGEGNDDITGSRDDNMIFGGEGNDTLCGGAGDDLLAGGIGDDRLSGGAGRNFLDGGSAMVKTHFDVSMGGLDPLVLDLDGDGIELSGLSSISPQFDIDGDLYAERTGWVKPDDGFLVRDLNGNGVIDDLTEMFGNSTTGGLAMLGQLDRNGDGKVDATDDREDTNGNGVIYGDEAVIAVGDRFSGLRVWQDNQCLSARC